MLTLLSIQNKPLTVRCSSVLLALCAIIHNFSNCHCTKLCKRNSATSLLVFPWKPRSIFLWFQRLKVLSRNRIVLFFFFIPWWPTTFRRRSRHSARPLTTKSVFLGAQTWFKRKKKGQNIENLWCNDDLNTPQRKPFTSESSEKARSISI